MNEPKPRKPRKAQLLPGATFFLAMVIYFNIRMENSVEFVDYAVLAAGAIFFLLALYWRIKFRGY